MDTQVTLILQQIGNHLALCMPSEFIKRHRLEAGQALTITVSNQQASKATDQANDASLEQMLLRFDPDKFSGEFVPSPSIGRERIK